MSTSCSANQNLNHPKQPCSECPWRKDQPAGRFPPERYESLKATSWTKERGSAPMGAPMFACHKSREGRDLACAGWLAVEGANHVGVRIALMQDRLDPKALSPGEDWPELYDEYAQMAEFNGVES